VDQAAEQPRSRGHTVNETPALVAPPWLLQELIRTPKEKAESIEGFEPDSPAAIESAREWLVNHAPEAIENRGGDGITYTVACRVKDFGIAEETCFELMAEHWNPTKAIPPWTTGELEQKVANAYLYGTSPIGAASPEVQFGTVELEEVPLNGAGLLVRLNIRAWIGRDLREREWVVRDRILKRQVALLSGDGGVGKTLIGLELATLIVLRRKEWLRSEIMTEGPAIVVCCEDDEEEFERRTKAIVAHHQGSLEALEKELHLFSLVDMPNRLLAVPGKTGALEPTAMFRALRELVCDIKPPFLMIDNAADVYGGDEINRTQVNQFVSLLRSLARDANTAVLLNAHPSLQGIASGRGTSGSTQWHNSVRQRMYMRHATNEEGADTIEGLRVVEMMKNSYGPGEGRTLPLRWQNGLFVPVDIAIEAQTAERPDEADALFLELLTRFEQQGRRVTERKRGSEYAPKVFSERPEAGQRGIGYSQLERAMTRLIDCGKIVLSSPEGRSSVRRIKHAQK
jgi:RecA-family ATPase